VLKWSAIAGAEIRLAYGGTDATVGNKCLSALDNQIQFSDPCNEIGNLVGCDGVLAIGGFSNSSASGGSPSCPGYPIFEKITSGKILVNNGAGVCLEACHYIEMIAHEIGHTLGAGHTESFQALMQPFIDEDLQFCGTPRADDEDFARCAYPQTQMTCSFKPSKTWTGPAPIGISFKPDVDGGLSPLDYDYDFGDGTSSSASAPTHVYDAPGTYTVSLDVADSDSRTCQAQTATITVNSCAPPTVKTVTPRQRYGVWQAVVTGTGFSKRSVVQVDAGAEEQVQAPRQGHRSGLAGRGERHRPRARCCPDTLSVEPSKLDTVIRVSRVGLASRSASRRASADCRLDGRPQKRA
jgi:hypothetical protein